MLVVDVISFTLLAFLLFWTVYNGSIIYVGLKKRLKHTSVPHDSVKKPKFSIIVPTKDEEIVIGRCLNSLVNIDYPIDKVEIIVVDGDSTDNTCKICADFKGKYPDRVKILKETRPTGKPAGLNLALPYCTGDIVGVFDADSVPKKDALKKVATYFDDEKVSAVQGRTISLNENKNALTRIVSMEERAQFQALLSGREKLNLFIPLNGSCQFVRRSVLEEFGGWNKNCLTEDVELALRLVEKKHQIRYAEDVVCSQETPNGLRDLAKQRVRWYRGYMETALKYGRLMDSLNMKTVDAEITMAGPYIMVISLLSYINWVITALLLRQTSWILTFTGIVIIATAVSLLSVGVGLFGSNKPFKFRNLLWVPAIYGYWLVQLCIAGWAFLKLAFRRKRVWSKTAKRGFITQNIDK